MGLCLGFSMETQQVSEMGRRIALVVPSGGAYEETTINYNFIPGDPSLTEFRNASINSTKLSDVRLYIKQGCDFTAPDLISDEASGLYVGSMTDPQVDSPNGLYQGSLNYMPGGAFVLFIAHTPVSGGANLSYAAASRTLTLAGGGSFVDYGFEEGDTCILDYFNSLDPMFLQIESVSSTEIVFTDATGDEATLTAAGDATGIATSALHGATPLVVEGYSGLDSCD